MFHQLQFPQVLLQVFFSIHFIVSVLTLSSSNSEFISVTIRDKIQFPSPKHGHPIFHLLLMTDLSPKLDHTSSVESGNGIHTKVCAQLASTLLVYVRFCFHFCFQIILIILGQLEMGALSSSLCSSHCFGGTSYFFGVRCVRVLSHHL